ncbi:MAG: bifunctional NADP-dependent methylenetetrahydromethanopterin dehydrogenase/methylenetetrahydrofolate dehydrogenase [Phycisphaeraceae bacterium]|nr:bifunctional NADP-dependent methylenetetrahydromethanopterin dehydrogenase/methylenetetrahydrofolate dehydrogenase [Phycisphaeraceae bacterium]
MASSNILILLDTDEQANSFDRVVAVDAGVDQLFAYSRVTLEQVQSLVHGAIFTRAPDELRHTAMFICGSDVDLGEQVLARVRSSFLGSLSVSVMLDANGANTTAAAAVIAAGRHLEFDHCSALVLAGTGPVGQRAARLLARQGASIRLASRSDQRASASADRINAAVKPPQEVVPCVITDEDALRRGLEGVDVVIAAGKAGVELLPASVMNEVTDLKVAIDLNAVPPLGIEAIGVTDKARDIGAVKAYGAIGVGGTKMKIHRAAVASLFESNDRVLDAEEIYALGGSI